MRILTNRDALLNALRIVGMASTTSSVEYEVVRLSSDGTNAVELCAADGTMSARSVVDVDDCEEFDARISLRLFTSACKLCPSEVVELDVTGLSVTVSAVGAKFSVQCLRKDSLSVNLLDLPDVGFKVQLKYAELLRFLRPTSWLPSPTANRQQFASVNLVPTGGVLEAVSSNVIGLMLVQTGVKTDFDKTLSLPLKFVSAIERLGVGEDAPIEVRANSAGTMMSVSCGTDFEITAPLYGVNFPDYKRILAARDGSEELTVNRAELLEVLDRLSAVISATKSPESYAGFVFDGGTCTLEALRVSERISDEFDYCGSLEKLKVTLAIDLLDKAVRSLDGETVSLFISRDKGKPVFVENPVTHTVFSQMPVS